MEGEQDDMFHCAYAFNQPIVLWDTSANVTCSSMFAYAKGLNQAIASGDVGNVR